MKNEFMGSAIVPLSDLSDQLAQDFWLELQDEDDEKVAQVINYFKRGGLIIDWSHYSSFFFFLVFI